MRLSDAAGLLFGTAMFVVGSLFLGWALFDGTQTGWDQLADGTEGTLTRQVPPTARMIAGAFGATLMTPITVIGVTYFRRRDLD